MFSMKFNDYIDSPIIFGTHLASIVISSFDVLPNSWVNDDTMQTLDL